MKDFGRLVEEKLLTLFFTLFIVENLRYTFYSQLGEKACKATFNCTLLNLEVFLKDIGVFTCGQEKPQPCSLSIFLNSASHHS